MGKAVVHLSGTVDVWDTDEDDWAYSWAPSIGGRDVIAALEEAFPWRYPQPLPRVVAYLGVEPVARGMLLTSLGFSGTDVTPPELPEIQVGGVELMDRLRDLEGRHVEFVVEALGDVGALPDER